MYTRLYLLNLKTANVLYEICYITTKYVILFKYKFYYTYTIFIIELPRHKNTVIYSVDNF